MKTMKKIFAMALAVVMIMSMTITVFSADTDLSGHTFKAYQIFKGTQATGSSELASIEWGDGVDSTDLLTELKKNSAFADCTTASDVATVVAKFADNSADAEAFAQIVYMQIDTTKGKAVGTTLNAGYYLVVDETSFDDDASNTVYNLALLRMTKDGTFTIASKADIPTVQIKVKDTNDSTNETTDWQDSADHDIGDEVSFQLTATLGDHVSDYEKYKTVFNDTLSEGFKDIKDVTLYVKVTPDSEPVKVEQKDNNWTPTIENNKLIVTIPDVEKIGATDNSIIIVEYTATLDTDAKLGSDGNDNTVYLEYSNNPNSGETSTGKTPTDMVTVFTYKFTVNKVDGDNAALKGAGFTLQKNVAGTYVNVGNEVKDEEITSFVWTGLDDGNYKLVETTTPNGYNTIDPIEFTISATHETDDEDPQLLTLEIKDSNGKVISVDNPETTDENEKKFDVADDKSNITTAVVNQKGTTLPSTGGIGTTLFYVLGGIMVLAAVVLLITKKRMASAE